MKCERYKVQYFGIIFTNDTYDLNEYYTDNLFEVLNLVKTYENSVPICVIDTELNAV